jgi:hypothetical protein
MTARFYFFTFLLFLTINQCFAQVDTSLFNRDQIWLFDTTVHKNEIYDGIIINCTGGMTGFDDAFYDNDDYHSCHEEYRQDKAVMSMWCTWCGGAVSKINRTYELPRSGYFWNIIKLTTTEMVWERGKRCEDTYDNADETTFYFKRYTDYDSRCLPVEDRDGVLNMLGGIFYIGVHGFNTTGCEDPYIDKW